MRILVTGGAGFIGSHLVDAYLDMGHEVFVIDNLETGKKENVNQNAHFILGDVRSDLLHDVVGKFRPDVISHHAGNPSVRDSIDDPVRFASLNFHSTLNVVEAARRYGVKRIIYGSTSTPLYDPEEKGPVQEEASMNPSTPYGVYAAASEMLLKSLSREVEVVCLRYSNVYGERQDPYRGGVVSVFFDRIWHDQVIFIHGDGWQRRDFVHVEDVCRANLSALDAGEGESIHICTGVETSIRALSQMIGSVVGKEPSLVSGEEEKVRPGPTSLSNRKAWDILGWSPQVSLSEGLRRLHLQYLG
ncbi:MAG: NAD-dependent epimerase/dehydratase family protein [Deltaproteobacteria bacterium]|nr:MAG: NAD-dependent epimerase/dehydratase family protein [Deltaproteobacteria bacterium]